jgi:hypothetical protein
MVITPNGGGAGISTPMPTLMSFNFYNTGSKWFNHIPWSIDTAPNPTKIWRIYDGYALPVLQWE